MYVDWIVNSGTGELYYAHFFVAAMGNSGYPNVEDFPNEKMDKWLLAHVNALEYYHGVPKIIVQITAKLRLPNLNIMIR